MVVGQHFFSLKLGVGIQMEVNILTPIFDEHSLIRIHPIDGMTFQNECSVAHLRKLIKSTKILQCDQNSLSL
jgi:hypothetical protein